MKALKAIFKVVLTLVFFFALCLSMSEADGALNQFLLSSSSILVVGVTGRILFKMSKYNN